MLINDIFEMPEAERAALTDEQIAELAYGIEYFSVEAGPQARHQMSIMQELYVRLAAVKAATAQRQQPQQQRHDYPTGRVLDCGCTVYDAIEVMNASLGTACADCYDRMS